MKVLTILTTVFLTGALALADQPTTNPAPTVGLVAPFQQVGDGHAWVGQALQEDLLATVTRAGLEARTLDKPLPGSDVQAAAQTARSAGAAFAITGTYQINGDQIRVNGQLTDAASARTVGALQATGDVRDLFKIEDTLSSQLQGILQPQQQTAATNTPSPSNNQLPQVTYGPDQSTTYTPTYTYDQNGTPQQTYTTTSVQPTYQPPYYYSYPYSYGPQSYYYPSYSYPYYPYFYGGIIISNGHFHDHFHDHFHTQPFPHGGFHMGGGFHGGMGGGMGHR